MNNNIFENNNKQDTKENYKKMSFLNIAILFISVITVILVIGVVFFSINMNNRYGVDEVENTYSINDVGKKYTSNDKYWTYKVGEDIPAGIYSTNTMENLEVKITFTDAQVDTILEKMGVMMTEQYIHLNTKYIARLPLVEGMEIQLTNYSPLKSDFTLTSTADKDKINLRNNEKTGIYKVDDSSIAIPVDENEELLIDSAVNIYTYSSEKEEGLNYFCMFDTCSISNYFDREYEDEIPISTLVEKNKDYFTLDLLDETYIVVA